MLKIRRTFINLRAPGKNAAGGDEITLQYLDGNLLPGEFSIR
jgi:hypothetical protein